MIRTNGYNTVVSESAINLLDVDLAPAYERNLRAVPRIGSNRLEGP